MLSVYSRSPMVIRWLLSTVTGRKAGVGISLPMRRVSINQDEDPIGAIPRDAQESLSSPTEVRPVKTHVPSTAFCDDTRDEISEPAPCISQAGNLPVFFLRHRIRRSTVCLGLEWVRPAWFGRQGGGNGAQG